MTPESPLHPINEKLGPGPSTQPLSQGEIRKQFLFDVFQERGVLVPLGISAIGLVYSLLYAPVLGGGRMGWVVTVAAGLLAASIFLWRSVVRYRQGYTRKLQELVARYEAESSSLLETRLQDAYASLEKGFDEINAQEGLKTLRGLEREYKQLQPVITRGEEADLLSISNLASLVRETYIQGLKVLEDALELERAIETTNSSQLQTEIDCLEQKAAEARKNPAEAESLVLIQEKIDSNKERLGMVAKLRLRIDELLHQADRCEASLNKTRIELAAIKVDASDASVTSVISTLQKTIERAKEVQAELKKLGY